MNWLLILLFLIIFISFLFLRNRNLRSQFVNKKTGETAKGSINPFGFLVNLKASKKYHVIKVYEDLIDASGAKDVYFMNFLHLPIADVFHPDMVKQLLKEYNSYPKFLPMKDNLVTRWFGPKSVVFVNGSEW